MHTSPRFITDNSKLREISQRAVTEPTFLWTATLGLEGEMFNRVDLKPNLFGRSIIAAAQRFGIECSVQFNSCFRLIKDRRTAINSLKSVATEVNRRL